MTLGKWFRICGVVGIFVWLFRAFIIDAPNLASSGTFKDVLALLFGLIILSLPAIGAGSLLNLKIDSAFLRWWRIMVGATIAATSAFYWLDPFGWEDDYLPKVGYLLYHLAGIYILTCLLIVIAGFAHGKSALIQVCCVICLLSTILFVLIILGTESLRFVGQSHQIEAVFNEGFAEILGPSAFMLFLATTISSLIAFIGIIFIESPNDRY